MMGGTSISSILLYSEINILCVVIMLIIAVNLSVSGFDKSSQSRMLSYSVYLTALANICDFLWNLCLTGAVKLPNSIRYSVDYIYFTAFGIASLCWLIYTDMVQKSDILKNKKLFAIYFMPLAVLVILLAANSFNGCLFYIDGSGKYYRGRLFYAQQVLSYGYIVISAVKCFLKATSRKNFAQRDYLFKLVTFVIPPIICGIIQIIVQDIPVLSVGIAMSYLLAYINSRERLISIDSLTGISNRRDLLQRLEDDIKSLKTTEDMYFLFIDIDSFKSINDTYGHNEGDRVLKEIAAALKKYVKTVNGSCGRYGGDEFALYIIKELDADFDSVCSGLDKFIEKQHVVYGGGKAVTVSMGCSKYLGDSDDIQGLVSRADEAMYSLKKEKRRMKNRGE